MKLLVIHGPNLNMLGIREPHIYGSTTMAQIDERLRAVAVELADPSAGSGQAIEIECFQSNHEGAVVDLIQQRHGQGLAGCVLNPGGLTTTSVSVLDAIKAVDYPFIEVHISNQDARQEDWRKQSKIGPACVGTVQGLGWRGYEYALRYFVAMAGEG